MENNNMDQYNIQSTEGRYTKTLEGPLTINSQTNEDKDYFNDDYIDINRLE